MGTEFVLQLRWAARPMPARDYGDLSRIALEADLDVDELRARLARMSDRALVEFGRAAAYMSTPYTAKPKKAATEKDQAASSTASGVSYSRTGLNGWKTSPVKVMR
jgi:hypothetical protein